MALPVLLVLGLVLQGPTSDAGTIPQVTVLDKVQSSRTAGLGGSGVAIGADPELIWTNPAAAAGASRSSLSIGGTRGGFDELSGQVLYALAAENGVVTMGLAWYNAGTVTANTPDGGTVRLATQQDVAGTFGFAGEVIPRITMGANMKFFRSELAGTYHLTTLAMDAGGQVRISDAFKVGAAIRNAGGSYRYAEDSASAPIAARVGAVLAWRPGLFEISDGLARDLLLLLGDVEDTLVARRIWYHAGAEYRVGEIIAFRGGWRGGPPGSIGGVSAGLSAGFSLPGRERDTRYRVDYAIEFNTGPFDRPQSVGLTVEW